MLPTSEFLFWFKVEYHGLSCQAFIGFLLPDIINLAYRFVYSTLVITNSFRSLGSAVVTLMFSKSERTYTIFKLFKFPTFGVVGFAVVIYSLGVYSYVVVMFS